jgi:probable HAF family extracellular repeat protein
MTHRAGQTVSLILSLGLISLSCTTDSPRRPTNLTITAAANASSPEIIDLGGDPSSNAANPYASAVNPGGVVVGRLVAQVVMWDRGTMTPIAPLSTCSVCFIDRSDIRFGINAAGQIVGVSNQRAFEWDHGELIDLSASVGGGSYASWINDAGDVLGATHLCTTAAIPCQGMAVIWRKGIPTALTLGGNYSRPAGLNAAGQAVGEAGLPVPPGEPPDAGTDVHAFLWDGDTMTDLGTLGGFESSALGINARGQVVGFARTADDAIHAVLWDHGSTTDLGEGRACAINAAGQIVGESGGRAVVWDHGQMLDIGVSGYAADNPLCEASEPFQHAPTINAAGVVALNACTNVGVCTAYLWRRGTLTTLDDLGGGYTKVFGLNPRGSIVGQSTTASGEFHAVLWTP